MQIIHNHEVSESRKFVEDNPKLYVLPWNELTQRLYPKISRFPSAIIRGKVITDFETVDDILAQSPPDSPTFYHSLQASEEYAAILAYSVDNPTSPIPFLTGVAIAAASEAKSYQEGGATDVSMARVEETLIALVQALPEMIGTFSKADIVTKINEIATATYAGFTLDA